MRQIKQNIKWENPDAAVVNAGIEQITNFLILKAIYKICKTIVLHMQIYYPQVNPHVHLFL